MRSNLPVNNFHNKNAIPSSFYFFISFIFQLSFTRGTIGRCQIVPEIQKNQKSLPKSSRPVNDIEQLKLNAEKMQLWLGTRQQLAKVMDLCIWC